MEFLWSDDTRCFLSQTSLTMMLKTVAAKLTVTEKRHNIEKAILKNFTWGRVDKVTKHMTKEGRKQNYVKDNWFDTKEWCSFDLEGIWLIGGLYMSWWKRTKLILSYTPPLRRLITWPRNSGCALTRLPTAKVNLSVIIWIAIHNFGENHLYGA